MVRWLEPLRAVALLQPQDTETGAKALLGMRLGLDDRLDQRDRRRPDLGGGAAGPRPLGVAAVGARHVLCDRGMPVRQLRAGVARNAASPVQNLDRGVGDAGLE